jgi:hypothetical protein
MPRSSFITRLFALIALLAWSNAQAMACCLTMLEQATVKSETAETGAMSAAPEDHSCCPGGMAPTEADAGTAGNDDGAVASADEEHSQTTPQTSSQTDDACKGSHSGAAGLCCTHTDPAEEAISLAPRGSLAQWVFVVARQASLPAAPPLSLQTTGSPPSLAFSGSPRYLMLERFLI